MASGQADPSEHNHGAGNRPDVPNQSASCQELPTPNPGDRSGSSQETARADGAGTPIASVMGVTTVSASTTARGDLPAGTEPTALQPTGLQPTGPEPTGTAPSGTLQCATVQFATVQSKTAQSRTEPSNHEMPGADRLGLERSAADPPGEDRSGLEPLAIDLLAEEPLGLAPSGANLSSAPQRADPAPWDPELRIQPPGHEPEQGGDGIGGDNTARQDSTIHHDLVAADLAVAGKKEAGLAEVELVDSSSGVAAIDASLRARNLALKAAGLRLRLERRGPWLGLRGPLPYRRGSDNSSGSESGSGGVKVQRLSLGLPASAAGLLEAEARLHLLQQQLAEGSFAWLQGPAPATAASAAAPSPAVLALAGRPTAGQPGPIPVSAGPIQASAAAAPPAPSLLAALEAFELAFFADPRRRRQPAGSRATWRAACATLRAALLDPCHI